MINNMMFKEYSMKTILSTVIICVAVASGVKYFNHTTDAMMQHNKQIEVAMASMRK